MVGNCTFKPGAEVECTVVLLALGTCVSGFEHFADFVGRSFLFHAADKSFAGKLFGGGGSGFIGWFFPWFGGSEPAVGRVRDVKAGFLYGGGDGSWEETWRSMVELATSSRDVTTT